MMFGSLLNFNYVTIKFMKANWYFVVFSVLMLLSFSAASGDAGAQNIYPDLLGDDWTETDYLDEPLEIVINDPLEPMNRAFFEFNDVFYEWILKPITDGYIWVMPRELRESFNHFFLNLAMPVRLFNSLLQGDLEKTGVVMERFLINSTLGVYGLADIADEEFSIKPRRADFGQTLGKWGLGEGIYFCWPVIGPSSVRGSVGFFMDSYSHPIPYFYESYILDVSYYTTNMVNKLSLNPNAYEDLKRYSVDPYIASRQAYYEYRKAMVDHH
jgi:phospholipid-binding lipoprotein MlaA